MRGAFAARRARQVDASPVADVDSRNRLENKASPRERGAESRPRRGAPRRRATKAAALAASLRLAFPRGAERRECAR
jgi:hypothetical protein